MEINIIVGGKAGQGIAKFGATVTRIFAHLGYYVFNYRDYPSLIQGGHNYNSIRISDEPIHSHEEENIDVLVALDSNTFRKHEHKLKEGATIICDKSIEKDAPSNFNLICVDALKKVKELNAPKIMENTVLLGALLKLFSIDLKDIEDVINTELSKFYDLQIKALQFGYESSKSLVKVEKIGEPKEILSGSEAVGEGAIHAGVELYIAYPMTPATPVLHYLAARQSDELKVLQLENEIACAQAALSASYAGALSMTGTSGGGFALMTETLSEQGMMEVPLVVYLAQRTGPSTGVPTYTEQADLKFALHAGHGEFPRVVVAPGDPQEAMERTVEAFYLSQKYNVLSIIISDKHLGESEFSFDKIEKPKLKVEKNITHETHDGIFPYYKITKNGVSPRAIPGENIVKANSYEHDELGITTEEADMIKKMKDKRLVKADSLAKEVEKMNPVSVYGNGDILLVGWGSTKGAILDAMREFDNVKFLQISYIYPFPKKAVLDELKKAKDVILIENNSTGMLGDVIAEQTGFIIDKKILRYDARSFTPSFIISHLKRLI
ncbi:MAG: 2-oxoacid:acceptor oxidoreductase subunit alpha [Candidatus Aenigmarchaeota archaeon]|nr:2-oxoacid:acceptor oxidoreductase subunit alpha [Candidatus Aenigmarchaeota archaeon]